MISYPADPIVEELLNKIKERSDEGMKKYSVPLTRKDMHTDYWRTNAIEELIDLLLYLQRSMRTRDETKNYCINMLGMITLRQANALLDFIYGPE